MSTRQFARFGSSMSATGYMMVGGTKGRSRFSVWDYLHLGSSLSLRGTAFRHGSALSMFDFVHFGTSLSIRGFVQPGLDTGTGAHESSFSVLRQTQFGGNLSVLDFMTMATTLSIRNFAKFGSASSVVCGVNGAAAASVLDYTICGGHWYDPIDPEKWVGICSIRNFGRIGDFGLN